MRTQPIPATPDSARTAGGDIACIFCGRGINPVFGISAHRDCQSRWIRAQSPPPRPRKGAKS